MRAVTAETLAVRLRLRLKKRPSTVRGLARALREEPGKVTAALKRMRDVALVDDTWSLQRGVTRCDGCLTPYRRDEYGVLEAACGCAPCVECKTWFFEADDQLSVAPTDELAAAFDDRPRCASCWNTLGPDGEQNRHRNVRRGLRARSGGGHVTAMHKAVARAVSNAARIATYAPYSQVDARVFAAISGTAYLTAYNATFVATDAAASPATHGATVDGTHVVTAAVKAS